MSNIAWRDLLAETGVKSLIRTGKRFSASPIMNFELAAIPIRTCTPTRGNPRWLEPLLAAPAGRGH
jgi:hypothetical protein